MEGFFDHLRTDEIQLEKARLYTQVIMTAGSVERAANGVIASTGQKRGAEKVSNATFGRWLKAVDAYIGFVGSNGLPIHGT